MGCDNLSTRGREYRKREKQQGNTSYYFYYVPIAMDQSLYRRLAQVATLAEFWVRCAASIA
jgi:hypothetical protein